MTSAEELRLKVRQIINEMHDDSAVGLLADDTRSIDEHILALLPDAVLWIQKNKGWGGVNVKSGVDAATIKDNGDGTGRILLPEDFVDIVALQMEGWQRPCATLFPSGSAVAAAQLDKYTRAGVCRPVCVDAFNERGQRVACYYSLPPDKEPRLLTLLYEARYNPDEGLAGNDEALHKAVAYQCAAMLYNVFERRDCANSLMAIAAAYCNNVQTNEKK